MHLYKNIWRAYFYNGGRLSNSEVGYIFVSCPLKLNVGNEATAVKFDAKMKTMTEKMKAHPGFTHATRYVCKVEGEGE
jgi:hypothetical protein